MTVQAQTNKNVVDSFFIALETQNLNMLKEIFAENGKQLNPYAPDGFPISYNGREAVLNQYSSLPQNFGPMKFPRKIFATEDPNLFFVVFKGDIEIKTGGKYQNDYVGTFKLENGQIVEYTEYFNQMIMAKAFGINLDKPAPLFKKVTFPSEGLTLTGNLFMPNHYKEGSKLPVILITGSWTTVKEQMPNLYAQKLADQGFIAFTFDFRTFGESEGQPRNYESPERKIEDIKNAFSYIETLPEVDVSQIYGLGICASSAYIARAVSEDKRVKKMALVAPWIHDSEIVKLIYGGEDGISKLIEKGKEAKRKFTQTGISEKVPMVSTTDENAPLYGDWNYYLNPERGAIKEWANEFNVMSWVEWLTFDGVKVGEKIATPTLLVHSKEAAIPIGAEQFYNKLKGNKHFHWTSGTQFDFYDQPEKVNESVEQVINWLR